MSEIAPSTWMAICGFVCGLMLGFAGRYGRFCTLGMLEDSFFSNDRRRLRAFALALAISIAGTQSLASLGLIHLDGSIYLSSSFSVVSAILGGLLFGVGMALVGTCGYGTLVRIGGGDLRAIVGFLVMGVSAMAAMSGITGVLRVRFLDPMALTLPKGYAFSLGDIGRLAFGHNGQNLLAGCIVLALAVWVLKSRAFRASPKLVLSATLVGVAIVLGWVASSVFGSDPFDPIAPVSSTFVAPLGNTLLYLMTFSGSTITFGVGSVAGVIMGSFLVATFTREFRWEACDDPRELKRHIIGSMMMGTGGILSVGCTIGQGLSAASTLAISAPIVMLAISLGARFGLELTMTGEWLPAFRNSLLIYRGTAE